MNTADKSRFGVVMDMLSKRRRDRIQIEEQSLSSPETIKRLHDKENMNEFNEINRESSSQSYNTENSITNLGSKIQNWHLRRNKMVVRPCTDVTLNMFNSQISTNASTKEKIYKEKPPLNYSKSHSILFKKNQCKNACVIEDNSGLKNKILEQNEVGFNLKE